MSPPIPVFAIVGPTASGKTELGIDIAERFDAEIINADSRQVFRKLDIGSAKPTAEQRARVRHHLVDVVEPDELFNVSRFRSLALQAIDEIRGRRKRVVLVGGSGLYVKVLRGGLFNGPSCDLQLRARLEVEETRSPGTLHRRLSEVDPLAAARVHARDRVRLVRALEVYELSGRPISDWQRQHSFGDSELQVRVIALDVSRPELYRRIDDRCEAMIAAGLVAEVRQLFEAGFDPRLPSLQSPGYRQIGDYVRGCCDLRTATALMAKATRNLAKRQLTWFRGDHEAIWIEPRPEPVMREARLLWAE